MKIYATPSIGKYYIEGEFSAICKAVVKDKDGRSVKQKKIIGNRAVIDLSDLEKGNYMVSVVSEEETFEQELIKE